MRKLVSNLLILLSFSLVCTHAMGDEDNLVSGVSNFLLERADDNYLYMLTSNIEENELFQCYFPSTYKYAVSGKESLKLLLTNRKLWEKSIEQDLDAFAARVLYGVLASGKVTNLQQKIADKYIELLQKIQLDYQGQLYPLTSIPLDASTELKAAINKYYDTILQARANIDSLQTSINTNAKWCDEDNATVAATQQLSFQQFKQDLDKLKQAFELNTEQLKVLKDNMSELSLTDFDRDSVDEIEDMIALLLPLYLVKEYEDQAESDSSYLMRVIKIESLINDSVEQGINPLGLDTESKDYSRFRRYAFSFAALADAETEEAVQVAMQELTLPPVSFGLKRQPGENGVFISSYFGGVLGQEEDASYSGLFVPVGIEYSRGIFGGSLSILVAPFDFAHPINLELKGNDESAEIEDIIRAGVYVSYGVKDYPISYGFGVSNGKSVRSNSDEYVTQTSIFIAIDMPLLRLF